MAEDHQIRSVNRRIAKDRADDRSEERIALECFGEVKAQENRKEEEDGIPCSSVSDQ